MATMHQPINSIDDVRKRRELLQGELDKKLQQLRTTYKTLTEPVPEPQGRASRFMFRAQNYTYLLDAAILGFKLYRSFRGSPLKRLFR